MTLQHPTTLFPHGRCSITFLFSIDWVNKDAKGQIQVEFSLMVLRNTFFFFFLLSSLTEVLLKCWENVFTSVIIPISLNGLAVIAWVGFTYISNQECNTQWLFSDLFFPYIFTPGINTHGHKKMDISLQNYFDLQCH